MNKRASKRTRKSERRTIRPEHDFSAAVRGVTAVRYAQRANIAVIDPDLLDVFPDGVTVKQGYALWRRFFARNDEWHPSGEALRVNCGPNFRQEPFRR